MGTALGSGVEYSTPDMMNPTPGIVGTTSGASASTPDTGMTTSVAGAAAETTPGAGQQSPSFLSSAGDAPLGAWMLLLAMVVGFGLGGIGLALRKVS